VRLLRAVLGDGHEVLARLPQGIIVDGFPTTLEPLYLSSPAPGLIPVAVELMGSDLRRRLADEFASLSLRCAKSDLALDWHRRFVADYLPRKRFKNPTPTVDAVIRLPGEDGECIVLVWRNARPLGWAIPGGFGEYRLRYEHTARKEATEEAGLAIVLDGICGVYSDPDRDPERPWGNTASVIYAAHTEGNQTPRPGSDAGKLGLFAATDLEAYARGRVSEIMGSTIDASGSVTHGTARLCHQAGQDLCFDHAKVLCDYFRRWPDALLGMEDA
jgi:8-oxo-dGTP diphosphatase